MVQTKKRSSWSRLAEFAAPHKGYYTVSVMLAVLGVAVGMAPYFAVSQIVIRLIEGGRDFAWYLTWCAIAAAGFLGKVLVHNLSTALSHKATFAVISEVRRCVAAKLTRVPMGYILDTPSGKLKNTMVEKIDSIEPTLAHVLPEMTSNLLVPVAIIVYLFVLDWRMALVSLITLPIGAVCYMGMMKGYAEKFGQYIAVGKHMNATAVEYINGIEVIKAFGRSATSYEKFTEAVKANANYGLDWMRECQIYFAMGIGIWPAMLIGVLPIGLLRNFSMMFQNVYLFNDTILNNIKFGKPDATLDEVRSAARKACCDDFIMALPNGYDTLIGEGGATISGGEKQRIAIARAILKDAPIVILNEATANVDPENENRLQEAIAELTKNKTTS